MPTIEIPDKICPHCGGTKWIIEIEKRQYSTITRYRCSLKAKERCKKWAVKNIDKCKSYAIKANKIKTESGYYKTENYKKQQTIRYYKERDALTDHFVKTRLANDGLLSQSEMPKELIELKRKELLLTRTIRNNGN
jgi:Ribonuclease G/E